MPRRSNSIVKKAAPKKTAKLEIRVTVDELTRWRDMADTKGRPLSEIAREAIDGIPVRARYQPKRSVDPDLLRELARIGNNLNQIARFCHVYKAKVNNSDVVLRLIAIERELMALREVYEDKALADEATSPSQHMGEAELPYPTYDRSVGD